MNVADTQRVQYSTHLKKETTAAGVKKQQHELLVTEIFQSITGNHKMAINTRSMQKMLFNTLCMSMVCSY